MSNYISDEQYLARLNILKELVDSCKSVYVWDDTTPGNKSTTSSVGLCHRRFSNGIKYRNDTHACPFDNRVWNPNQRQGSMRLGVGCYYTCILKNKKMVDKLTKSIMNEMIEGTIRRFQSGYFILVNNGIDTDTKVFPYCEDPIYITE